MIPNFLKKCRAKVIKVLPQSLYRTECKNIINKKHRMGKGMILSQVATYRHVVFSWKVESAFTKYLEQNYTLIANEKFERTVLIEIVVNLIYVWCHSNRKQIILARLMGWNVKRKLLADIMSNCLLLLSAIIGILWKIEICRQYL